MDENTKKGNISDENGRVIVTTEYLIETIQKLHKTQQKECKFKDLIFELGGKQKYDFTNILTKAGAVYKTGDINKSNINLNFDNCIFKSPVFFFNLSFEYFNNFTISHCTIDNTLIIDKCKFINISIYGLNGISTIKDVKIPTGNFTLKDCTVKNTASMFFTNNESIHLINNDLSFLIINDCVGLNNLKILQNKIKENLTISGCTIELLEFVMLKDQNCKVYIQDTNFNTKLGISEGVIDKNFIFRNSYLKNLKFGSAILDNAQFINCNFGDYKLYDEQQLYDNEIKTNEQYNVILNQYKALEKNFDFYKNYEEAGEFHKRQFEVQRIFADNYDIKKYILWLYKVFSGYGENYVRSIVSFLLILILFALIYLGTGLDYVKNANSIDEKNKTISTIFYGNHKTIYNPINDLGVSLLYSLSNTLPIRKDLESIKPANEWTRFFAFLEITFQSVILTLFVIALRRKFKR